MSFSKKILSILITLLIVGNNTAFANNTFNNDESGIIYEDITPEDFYIEDISDEELIPDDSVISDEPPEMLYTEEAHLSEGLEYTRNLYYHPTYGNEREYILEYTSNDVTKLNFTGNNYLYTVKSIKDMAAENYPDSNIVAAINGDFFNMSTGVPESAFIKNYELYTTDRDSFCLALDDDGRYFFDKPSIKLKLIASDGIEINIAHLNKEFSEYALYLYNSRYSDTTHIKSSYSQAVLLPFTEVKETKEIIKILKDTSLNNLLYLNESDEDFWKLIEKVEEQSDYKYVNGNFYKVEGTRPQIGKSENVVVYSTDSNCSNGKIPENAYILCGDNTSYGYIPASMKPGDVFTLTVSGNERFENVVDAIGVGAIIINDSEVIDNRSQDHYTSLQPRSAVGIKEDGSLVFYAVDGRQKNKSSGLKLYDLGEKMKELGCTYAANLDGGGSTVVYASRPGFDTSDRMNNPSGVTERKISNSFIFTSNVEKTNIPISAHFYNDYLLTYSDWLINIENTVISDEKGFQYVPAEDENVDVRYYTDNDISVVVDSILYPVGVTGKINVFADVNGETNDEKPVFSVHTITAPDVIELKSDTIEIAPFETATLNVESFYKNLKVSADPLCYVWSVKASDEDYATGIYGSVENGVFYPKKPGEVFTITASRGEASDSVTITVDTYPFSDIENHWSVKEVYKLAKKGVVNGYPTEDGLPIYLPENSYSRYEFCAMLERMTDIGDDITVPNIFAEHKDDVSDENVIDETDETTDEVTDASNDDISKEEASEAQEEPKLLDFADSDDVPEWAYSSLYKLYFSGWLDGIMQADSEDNLFFNGNDFITREDVMKVIGRLCGEVPEDFSIGEYSDLSDEQIDDVNIKKCIYAGIFNGYEDMTLRLSNYLTRAEAATIFVRLQDYIEKTKNQISK